MSNTIYTHAGGHPRIPVFEGHLMRSVPPAQLLATNTGLVYGFWKGLGDSPFQGLGCQAPMLI